MLSLLYCTLLRYAAFFNTCGSFAQYTLIGVLSPKLE
jgi:hypothetical protein